MADTTTLNETLRSPIDGTEYVRLATPGANWKAQLSSLARTKLTADVTYYVSLTGSDANNGSVGSPWRTLQHSMDVISSTIDIAGFNITVSIGAGSFAGLAIKSTVGGGNILWQGTGTATTTVTDGPNDGFYNFGECIDIPFPAVDTFFFFDGFTLQNHGVNVPECVVLYEPGTIILGQTPSNISPLRVAVDCSFMSSGKIIDILAASGGTLAAATLNITGGNGTITNAFIAQGFSYGVISLLGGAVSGNLTVTDSFASAINFSSIDTVPGFTGAGVTGKRFRALSGGTIFGGPGPLNGVVGGLGPNGFPGTVAGTIEDNVSSYDGFYGVLPVSGSPSLMSPTAYSVSKDTGSDQFAVYTNDAGTVKQITRRILSADVSYYVATTGSDSNPGTLASPWLTLEHAANVISQDLDFAGFTVTVNIGAGTFAGCELLGTVGGGVLQFNGAGSGSTTVSDFTGLFAVGTFQISGLCSAQVGYNKVAMHSTVSSFVGGIAVFYPGNKVFFGDIPTNSGADIIIKPASGVAWVYSFPGVSTFLLSGTYTLDGGSLAGGQTFAGVYFDSAIQDNATWTFTNTPDFTGVGFVNASVAGSYQKAAGSFTGASTGQPFIGSFESAVSGINSGVGNVAGILDPSCSSDGFVGVVMAAGLPTTTQFPNQNTGGLYKDTSGGGVYMVYNDAGTIKKVALT